MRIIRVLFMRPPDEPPPPPPEPIAASNIPVAVPVALEEGVRVLEGLLREGWPDCLLYTSLRGPRFTSRLAPLVRRMVEEGGLVVGAVGPRTAEEVEKLLGVKPGLVPGEYRGEALGRLAAERCRRVVVARSKRGLPDIVEVLKGAGVEVRDIPVYDMVYDDRLAEAAVLAHHAHDYVAFTSPGIAEAFARALKRLGVGLRARVVSIGPSTSKRLRSLGLRVDVEASEYTVRGVYEAVLRDAGV